MGFKSTMATQELVHAVYLGVTEWSPHNPPHAGEVTAADRLPRSHERAELLARVNGEDDERGCMLEFVAIVVEVVALDAGDAGYIPPALQDGAARKIAPPESRAVYPIGRNTPGISDEGDPALAR